MLTVACVKWGTLYGPEYVNNLRDMVRRQLSLEHRFICFTDDPKGLDDDIEVRELPGDLEGWWNKLWLFSGVLEGRVLYFDLDTLIVRNIDGIASYNGDFAILRDFYRRDGYGSGVMAWNADEWQGIWRGWDRKGRPEIDGGDQAWIEYWCRPGGPSEPDFWQDMLPGEFVSFKEHCLNGPPMDARVVCFHGLPRPHQVKEEWVTGVWCKGGWSLAQYEATTNVAHSQILEQIEENCERDIPWIEPCPPHNGTMVLCAGGPSLEEQIPNIRARKKRGQDIWAMNGTHDFLIGRGIVPDYFLLMDAREENVRFVQNPRDDVTYLISSMCHPKIFEALEGRNVVLWHANIDGIDGIMEPYKDRPIGLMGGGGTIGLRSIFLGYWAMGYRKFHLYGYDSCYRTDRHHAYDQPMNDGQETTDVIVAGRRFTAAWWMVRQANEFREHAAEWAHMGCQITTHGDGLIPWVAKQMNQRAA